MKKIAYSLYTALLVLTLVFQACEKNAVQVIDAKVTSGAQVRFFNFAPNAPSVNYYANDQKLSATLSSTGAESATGVAFGVVFPASSYNLVPAGNYTLRGLVPSTATTNAGKTITSFQTTLQDQKYYSFFSSGIYNTATMTAEGFIIEDNIPTPDDIATNVRFVNAISNSTPLDVYVKNTNTGVETKIASAVAYKSNTDFVKVPFGVYDVTLRLANTTTVLGAVRTAQSFVAQRAVTLTARGDATVTASSSANRPFIDNTINR